MTKPKTIQFTNFLAVEGKDEVNFFNALLKHLSIENVQVESVGGKTKFRQELRVWYSVENFNNINNFGFIRDADENPANSAFDSICSVIRNLDIPTPTSVNQIAKIGDKKTGIFIMPNNSVQGMLEDLCLQTIENTPLESCINSYVSCFSSIKSTQNNLKKSKILAFLAAEDPTAYSIGLAAQKNIFDFTHSCFDQIKAFLNNLFNTTSAPAP